jgi:opacity protein-like surface antigen
LAAGVTAEVHPHVSLELGYRYMDLGKVESGTSGTSEVTIFAPTSRTSSPSDSLFAMQGRLRVQEIILAMRIAL